jgi:hypothetical protein
MPEVILGQGSLSSDSLTVSLTRIAVSLVRSSFIHWRRSACNSTFQTGRHLAFGLTFMLVACRSEFVTTNAASWI